MGIIKIAKNAAKKLVSIRRESYCRRIRKGFNNSDFTFLTNNCIAGVCLHNLGQRFDTPTVNLYMDKDDFIKFAANLKSYAASPLTEVTQHTCSYPVGVLENPLGNITLNFMHYKSFADAAEKWKARCKRIHYDNIYVLLEAAPDETPQMLEAFEALPYENKVVLIKATAKPTPSSHTMSFYDDSYYYGKILSYKNELSAKRFIDDFDYVGFLNKKIKNF